MTALEFSGEDFGSKYEGSASKIRESRDQLALV